ncbi:MAG TPA: MoxR family ATPase [Chloroflexaceae bacterium]|nr:MoxR family ATPase [Chloroflexaceae bacterium]
MVRTEELAEQLRAEARKVLVGQEETFTLIVVTLLAGGHVLLEGVPGTAKTLMAKTLALLLRAEYKRVQFTPDLMPSDVVGTQVFEPSSGQFRLRRGPIFCQVLLGDEINRAPAKTQSALLEAMEERQVTIEGERLPLPDPFFVIATQNPVEYEGTYPLPEAQLDRFLFKLLVDYPPGEVELEVLRRYHRGFDARRLEAAQLRPVVGPEGLAACREEIGAVTVEDGVLRYIGAIAQESRRSPDLILGGSTRASVALLLAAKAYAAVHGRDYVTPDDVKALARPVYRHRVILRPEAEIEGLTPDSAVGRILGRVEVPR